MDNSTSSTSSKGRSSPRRKSKGNTSPLLLYSATVAIMFLISSLYHSLSATRLEAQPPDEAFLPDLSSTTRQVAAASSGQAQEDRSSSYPWSDWFPSGSALPLPAMVAEDLESVNANRVQKDDFGGGQGDPRHLGGFDEFGKNTISPTVWKHMISKYNIQSILDVGCGRGWSTLWFQLHGIKKATCVEASKDAIRQTVLQKNDIVEHDYTLGPWWPDETYDAIWAADLMQQVSWPYHANVFATFRKAALVFVTVPAHDVGWHHVEAHDPQWWIRHFVMQGFRYDDTLTQELRKMAGEESKRNVPSPDGKTYRAKSIAQWLLVFFNPLVSSKREHIHLFQGFGCFQKRDGPTKAIVNRECGIRTGKYSETKLDPSLYPKQTNRAMDEAFDDVVRAQLGGGGSADNSKRKTTKLQSLLGSAPKLNYSNHAVVRIHDELKKGNTSLPKIPVVVWPYFEFGVRTSESLHIEERGIAESPYLDLSTDVDNFDPNVVWVGDTGYAYGWNFWCAKFNEHVKSAQHKRSELGLPLQWPIFIIDFTDGFGRQRCKDVEAVVGKEWVHYSERAIVRAREYSNATDWIQIGTKADPVASGVRYMHTPLIVRTDTIANLQSVLATRGKNLWDPIEELDRSVDVTHLWPLDTSKVGTVHSLLRTRVSKLIDELGQGGKVNAYVGLAGDPVRTGRRGVKSDYIEALLNTKIIVITQRDAWEDHYRLFEALIGGACVFTDRMLSMPIGLKDGESIVEFTSAQDLLDKIHFYLKDDKLRQSVARQGRRVAMERHRAWHRIEEIIFGGEPLSTCERRPPDSHCPYTLHAANETAARRRRIRRRHRRRR